MLQFLVFNDLFQRPLIPIGNRDKAQLQAMYPGCNGKAHLFSGWLIALMWYDADSPGWKVLVFPVEDGNAFWVVPPLFHTHAPSTFDKAWKLSEAIKTSCLNDQLTEKFVNPYWDDWSSL